MKWDDIRQDWFADPEFRQAFEREYPFHDLSLEIGGLRADMDLTQTEFGRLVGVPQSTVARLESGQQNPSVGTLKRIAEASGAELVIEFRQPKRGRRAKRRTAAASSADETPAGAPLAASGTDD
jgi:transcriptional regulator with XRE-family HTH domain